MAANLTPNEALKKLMDGNSRFEKGVRLVDSMPSQGQRTSLAEKGQTPFAIILGCADSRAPAEYIFDAGLGDLFVVRVAGNIVTPGMLGSIEFAALNFGTPLCVVLGHTKCGAVAATASLLDEKKRAPTDHIQDIVLEIEPSVRLAKAAKAHGDLVEDAIRLNVVRNMERISERSIVINKLISEGRFRIVGGVYNLHTGRVEILEQ